MMGDARWQMLPGGLLETPGAKRSARDWIVDATMLAIALAIGGIALATTASRHSGATLALDVLIGLAALAALWWRRRYPFAVAVVTILPGAVSAMATGAGLIALFNVALRGSRRAIVTATVLSVAVGAAFP